MSQGSHAHVENVVLIVIDALRADRVGAYTDCGLTPNIDSLAEDGEVFENCYSCINTTDPSVTTILTGQYPTRHGVLNHGSKVTEEEMNYAAGTTSVAELLGDSFRTIGADTLERWHSRGFDMYYNPNSEGRSGAINVIAALKDRFPTKLANLSENLYSKFFDGGLELGDSGHMTEAAIELMKEANEPFFTFLHYWDPHIPYEDTDDRPDAIAARAYDDDQSVERLLDDISGSPWEKRLHNDLLGDVETVGDIKRNYDTGVVEADRQVGRVVDYLKSEGVYEDTAIIITADHGESFAEHGILFDHHGLYEVTTHVPLVISAPGFDGRETEFVQHFDLVPTILDLAREEYEPQRFDGESLATVDDARTLDRDAVFSEEAHTTRRRSIRTESHRYIECIDDMTMCRYCEVTHAPRVELYDLGADPEERVNVASEREKVRETLASQLREWVDSLPDPSRESETYEVSDEVKDHLEEMGYV
jgi:arylsulfatase A-like enzyme